MSVIVWSQPGCGPCYALKGALRAADVPFDERLASDAPDADIARWRAAGWQTPVVQHAGGEFAGFIPARVKTLIDMRR